MRTLTFSILAVLAILGIACKSDKHDSDSINVLDDPGVKAYMRKHYQVAMHEFEPRANQGDPVAQCYIGLMYASGQGVKKDENKASEWFSKFDGTAKKLQKESPWKETFSRHPLKFYLAYAKGYTPLHQQIQEGRRETFRLSPKDYTEEDVRRLKYMAEDNHVEAQYRLGLLYVHEETKVKNYIEGAKWYERAASQGHASAQNNLAALYKEGSPGVGGKKNLKKALRLFFEAGQQGLPAAQYNLGNLFNRGINEISILPNNEEAYYWYSLAGTSDSSLKNSAIDSLGKIENKLGTEQINEVQSRAKKWQIKTQPGSGSGFYITPEHILTNEHVIRGADEIFVSFLPVEVVAEDSLRDLALLKIDSDKKRNAVAKFRSSPVELAEDIGVYGYPLPKTLSYDGNFTKGSVSALVGLGLNELLSEHLQSVRWPNDLFQFTAPIQGGNSGGPVFDKAGNVVGVAVMQRRPYSAQNVNFAINFNAVKAFLQEHDLIDKVKVDSASINTIGWTGVAKQTQEFTVPILSFKNK